MSEQVHPGSEQVHPGPEPGSPKEIVCALPDDWHLHLRDGDALKSVVLASALQFGRAIVMPNLKPPITRLSQALEYRDSIRNALKDQMTETIGLLEDHAGRKAVEKQWFFYRSQPSQDWMLEQLHQAAKFEPLMTLYLTDQTAPEEIDLAVHSGVVKAVKLYPAGATTHSDAGVTSVLGLYPVFERMQKLGLPLLVHGEVTDPEVDVFDREAVFIDRVMLDLRRRFPALRIVFEHITTQEAAHFVRDAEAPIAATITPQHLLYNRNAIFNRGLRPHWYCLPVLKRERHRLALLEAAVSGSPRFFLGTDSAPHAAQLKEHAAACAGCYSAPHALALYASVFDAAAAIDRWEGFACSYGAAFYGLQANQGKIRLVKEPCPIPEQIAFVPGQKIVPLAGGDTVPWRFDGFILD